MNSLIRWECKLGDEIEIWGGSCWCEIIFGYIAFEREIEGEVFERMIRDDSTKMCKIFARFQILKRVTWYRKVYGEHILK